MYVCLYMYYHTHIYIYIWGLEGGTSKTTIIAA